MVGCTQENPVPEIFLPSSLAGVVEPRTPTLEMFHEYVTVAGDHPLLRRIRSGESRPDEVLAWLQTRCCLAEYLAKKEVLVLAKTGDREARRLWVPRLLAIDGHGDFYGPSKHGLIEGWRRLLAQADSGCEPSPSFAELISSLHRLFEQHLLLVREATWIEALGASMVDDWIVQNDCMTAGMLPGALESKGLFRCGGKPESNTELAANTMAALDTQLARFGDGWPAEQALKSINTRVELEHAILTVALDFSLRELG
jgi:hypothetical protein